MKIMRNFSFRHLCHRWSCVVGHLWIIIPIFFYLRPPLYLYVIIHCMTFVSNKMRKYKNCQHVIFREKMKFHQNKCCKMKRGTNWLLSVNKISFQYNKVTNEIRTKKNVIYCSEIKRHCDRKNTVNSMWWWKIAAKRKNIMN